MIIPSDKQLLDKIEAFLVAHDMSPTRFGIEATGERSLVKSIKDGRSLTLRHANRIAEFMENYVAEANAAEAATSPGKSDEISPCADEARGQEQGSKAA